MACLLFCAGAGLRAEALAQPDAELNQSVLGYI